jgi:hypothetical protein
VFDERVLRRLFGLRGEKVKKLEENYIMRIFAICTLHQILLGRLTQGG